jgi:hypothetical protein
MLHWLQRIWERQTSASIAAKGALSAAFVAFLLSPDGAAWLADTVGPTWVPLITLMVSTMLGRASKPPEAP